MSDGNLQGFRDIFPELRHMDISNLLRELKEEKNYACGVKEVRTLGIGLKFKLHLKKCGLQKHTTSPFPAIL